MKKLMGLAAAAALVFSSSVMAEFDMAKVYVGGGAAYNSPDSSGLDSAIGFQGFAGYDMADIVEISDEVGFAVEVGYALSGDFEIKNCTANAFFSCAAGSSDGLWSTAVFDYAINDEIKAIGRIGYDFADADGLMFGAGVQYGLNEQMAVVGEYVIRDIHKGIQANFIYYLGD